MQIKLLVEGGAMKPGPALSQQLGPAGVNIGQVISKINDATKDFNGLKVPVMLDVNLKTKAFDITIFSPPVSELIKKQLKLEKGSGEQKKLYAGNASIEDVISVAKTKLPSLLCTDLKSAVKTVLGTCVSLGILVESKLAKEIEQEINIGKYDKEIKECKTETLTEKRKKLDDYFAEIHSAQEKQKKVEEAAEAAAAEAKAAEAGAKPAEAIEGTPAATPATATTETAKPSKPAKSEKK